LADRVGGSGWIFSCMRGKGRKILIEAIPASASEMSKQCNCFVTRIGDLAIGGGILQGVEMVLEVCACGIFLELEYGAKFGEGIEFEQVLAFGGGVEGGVLEDPGAFVEEEDGMEAGGQGRVDIALGAVADHPTGVRC
jgi:hypothetical protein